MHIPEERMVNMSQVVAVCLPFTHTHIMYTLQVEKTWFVSNFLIASGAYTWPWETGTSTSDVEFLTWSHSGCVILDQVLKLSVLLFCYLEVGVYGINAHEFE